MTADPNSQDWVTIAYVARPHALRGGVLLKGLTRYPHDLLDAPLSEVTLRRGRDLRSPMTITSLAAQGDMLLARFEGIEDRNSAEDLVGWEVLIPADQRWELPEGAYYVDDLVGMEAIETATGKSLGAIIAIREGNAHDYLAIPHPNKKGKEVLLPFIAQFVGDVDTKNRKIAVVIPAGLFDL